MSSGKTIIINRELKQAIVEILAEEPKIEQDKLIEKIVAKKLRGLPESVIKVGVRGYLIANPRSVPEAKALSGQPQQPIEIVENEGELKPKKKVKKNEFLIDFENSQNYKFERLGGIEDIQQKIESDLFGVITREADFKAVSRLPPNRGFLLSGSPGSGKTILANCILSYLSTYKQKLISTYSVNSYEFMGGDAEEKIKKLF
jgi:SpoVK/Ycf46/Vps4 family AAA+-type ATPase